MASAIYAVHYDEGFNDGSRNKDSDWRNRIQKRIDELEASRDIDMMNHVDRTQVEAGIIELKWVLSYEGTKSKWLKDGD